MLEDIKIISSTFFLIITGAIMSSLKDVNLNEMEKFTKGKNFTVKLTKINSNN